VNVNAAGPVVEPLNESPAPIEPEIVPPGPVVVKVPAPRVSVKLPATSVNEDPVNEMLVTSDDKLLFEPKKPFLPMNDPAVSVTVNVVPFHETLALPEPAVPNTASLAKADPTAINDSAAVATAIRFNLRIFYSPLFLPKRCLLQIACSLHKAGQLPSRY